MSNIERNIEKLEERVHKLAKRKKISLMKFEAKYDKAFERQAMFLGNGIYGIAGLYSTDTRELKLMFILQQNGVKASDKNDKFNEDE